MSLLSQKGESPSPPSPSGRSIPEYPSAGPTLWQASPSPAMGEGGRGACGWSRQCQARLPWRPAGGTEAAVHTVSPHPAPRTGLGTQGLETAVAQGRVTLSCPRWSQSPVLPPETCPHPLPRARASPSAQPGDLTCHPPADPDGLQLEERAPHRPQPGLTRGRGGGQKARGPRGQDHR